MQNTQTSAAQTVQGAQDEFMKLMAQKSELTERLGAIDVSIQSIRSVMQGVQLGQALQVEVDAEKAAAAQAEAPLPETK